MSILSSEIAGNQRVKILFVKNSSKKRRKGEIEELL